MKANNKICGIYCIENIANGKKYIGQSRDIKHRFSTHKMNLNKNIHANIHLQSAWNMYGIESFKFYIIEECDQSELDDKEVYYIKIYNSMTNGYNLNSGGQGIPAYKHTPEEIEKMIQIQNPEPIYQCDLNLNIIKEWPSASMAAKTLGIYKLQIENCCKKMNKVKTVHNHIFVFKKDWDNLDRDYYLHNNRDYPITVLQINNNGDVVQKWNSMYDIEKTLHIDCGEISAVCSGKRNTSHDFFWIKESDYTTDNIEMYKSKFIRPKNGAKTVYKCDINGQVIKEFISNSECMKHEHLSRHIFEKYIDSNTLYNNYYYTHKLI